MLSISLSQTRSSGLAITLNQIPNTVAIFPSSVEEHAYKLILTCADADSCFLRKIVGFVN